jgi:hypothetical protein
LADFEAQGAKPDDYVYYHTLNFLEKNLESYYPEDVDSYNAAIIGRLLKWLLAAFKLRRQDIIRRKALQRKARDYREDQIQKEAKRQERMQQETQEAEQQFIVDHKEEIDAAIAWSQRDPVQSGDEEEGEPAEKEVPPVMPVFNTQEFLAKWLIENPAFEIPEEVVFDVDNDWVLSQSEAEYHINAYFGRE